MKYDTYKTKNIDQKYVYRYLTIEKLIDFLESNSIYLSRLDKFEDNLENISPYFINELKGRTGLTEKPQDANPDIPDHQWEALISKNKKQLKALQENLLIEQRKRFVSCWILSDVESFAMWDIYGKAGFAIRFERKYFQKLIRESVTNQDDSTNEIDLLLLGKVQYQNYDDMFFREKESLLKYSVFRKHLSFYHENEYRLVGFCKEQSEHAGLRYKIPDIETLDFEIIANPRLDYFQFEKFKSIISHYSIKHKLTESPLKIWLEFRDQKF